MGRALLAFVAVIAACGDRYGSYFVIDGHGEIKFDRLELYFGKNIGAEVPVTPANAISEPEPGLLAERLFADSDVVTVPAQVGTLTYFVPPFGDNAKLGDYLLAIVYAGDQPVGVAELFDFKIPTDELVYLYKLPLAAYANERIEVWGRPTSDCVRWTRDRGPSRPATVAVVRGDDVDCDAFVDRDDPAVDCEPLRYCDGTGGAGCIGDVACVTVDNGCRIGACQNVDGQRHSCAPTMCTVDQACSSCDLGAPPGEVLDCALLAGGTHLDYPITVKPSLALCAEPYTVYLELPPGVTCANPKVEATVNWMPGAPFLYQIATGPGSACLLSIAPPAPGTPFEGIPHLLISFDSMAGPTARQTFIVGLSTGFGGCGVEQTVIIDPGSVSCLQ